MSFQSELLAALGGAADAWDIRAIVRRCFFYDFQGYPVRLWHGVGTLHAGGEEWLGTIDPAGVDHHTAPAVADPRSGASPRYTFGIPYLDGATFAALKADQDRARGRDLTCYHVMLQAGEGLRASEALRFNYRLEMRGVEFAEAWEGLPGEERRAYRASVLCRSAEAGRSRVPAGTYTDTAQRERARILGFGADSFCAFVAGNSRRTLTIEGD